MGDLSESRFYLKPSSGKAAREISPAKKDFEYPALEEGQTLLDPANVPQIWS